MLSYGIQGMRWIFQKRGIFQKMKLLPNFAMLFLFGLEMSPAKL